MKNICAAALLFVLLASAGCKDRELERQRSQTELAKLDQSNKEKCADRGAKLFHEYQQRWGSGQITWYDPTYHFNKRLNTCLMQVRWQEFYGVGDNYKHQEIIDVLENKTLIVSGVMITYVDDGKSERKVKAGISEAEFETQAKNLMKE